VIPSEVSVLVIVLAICPSGVHDDDDLLFVLAETTN
jgi:hypothetical protein